MVRTIAFIFGILFLIGGILGFMPAYAPNGMLVGCFYVNPAHNLIHLITGIIFLVVACKGLCATKIFFKIFGIIYVIVALLGLYYGDQPILGIIANNSADVGLHFVTGIIALLLGFGCEGKHTCA
jgi:hypothetical protein